MRKAVPDCYTVLLGYCAGLPSGGFAAQQSQNVPGHVARVYLGSKIDKGRISTGSITGLEGGKELLDYSATKRAIHASQNRWPRIW